VSLNVAAMAPPRVVSLDAFADTPEEGEEALLGDRENTVVPENGDVMVYGDGGAGKTTLVVDLACHLAAGDPWLGIGVAKPRRVLLVENEGPRPKFRAKLRRKRDAWNGSPLEDRISVLEDPWGAFTFADEVWRTFLAEHVQAAEIDVVVCGPVTCAGMTAAGTLQEVRDFLALVADVRRRAGRPLVVVLIHHENKGGKVSGAWEGAGDTLVHVSAQGHGRTRVHFQKTRWASEYHATTLQLIWADGDSFAVEEHEELDDEALAARILDAIATNAGTSWSKVERAIRGIRNDRIRAVRDGLFASRQIANVVKNESRAEELLFEVPERRPSRLYLIEDPTIRHLRPGRGAVGAQAAPPWEERVTEAPAPCAPPLKGAQGAQAQSVLPVDEVTA
jgi:hypothetical protein